MANYTRNTKKENTITDVRIYPIKNGKKDSKLLAFASVTLVDVFAITGIKIYDGKDGYFVSMPSMKTKDGDYKDICYPVTKEFREELINTVIDAYIDETK